jgi:hypothetical protein
MAELNRTAKSGSEWTIDELLAYRIIFKSISPIQFFSSPNPSLEHLDPAVLKAAPGTIDAQLSKQTIKFLSSLDFAIAGNYRAYIDDFARETLYLLGFAESYMIISTRHTIPLKICGKTSETAETNVCVVYLPRPTLIIPLVLVTDDSASTEGTNAEAQAIAGAVAAFQFNNNNRKSLNLAPLEVMTIPCITLSGTSPTFYLVPVSRSLSNAVATGQYPPTQTDVLKCVTSLDDNAGSCECHASDSIGMGNIEYRGLALQRFLAFKTLAESYWKEIVQDVHAVLSKLLQVPCSL